MKRKFDPFLKRLQASGNFDLMISSVKKFEVKIIKKKTKDPGGLPNYECAIKFNLNQNQKAKKQTFL